MTGKGCVVLAALPGKEALPGNEALRPIRTHCRVLGEISPCRLIWSARPLWTAPLTPLLTPPLVCRVIPAVMFSGEVLRAPVMFSGEVLRAPDMFTGEVLKAP
eukprot:Selendium_serpulae@DN5602_c2_g1_i3.p2